MHVSLLVFPGGVTVVLLRVDHDEFAHPVREVEEALLHHHAVGVLRREDLEDHCRRHALLAELLVRAPVALRSTEADHDVGGCAEVWSTLDGVPEVVARDEVGQHRVEVLLDADDPFVVEGVVRHGLPVAVWIEDRIFSHSGCLRRRIGLVEC